MISLPSNVSLKSSLFKVNVAFIMDLSFSIACPLKSGLISITKWLSKYYSGKKIRVNCVSPGGIISSGQDKSFLKAYRDSCNNIGMLNPNHLAPCIAFLLSDSAEAINGQNLIIDDGWSL